MYTKLDLKTGDLKYWIDEFPTLEEVETQVKRIEIPIEGSLSKQCIQKKVALEIYLHKNANNYAMLGMEYIPNDNRNLIIEVQYILENEVNYESSITKFNHYKYVGLPEEYVDVILEEVKKTENILTGTIKIPIAANCEVGSSPFMFSSITNCLLDLICNKNENLNVYIENLYTKYYLNDNI